MTQKITVRGHIESALQKPNRRYKFRELCAIGHCSKDHLNQVIGQLRAEGWQIVYGKQDHRFFLSKIPTPYSNYFDMTWLPLKGKLGVCSDTHLCSNAERLDIINEAYDVYEREGITVVIHAGDISDGWQVYPGHEQNVKCIGAQEQAKYVIEKYPSRKGIKTYFIGGNHDLKSFAKQGIDQCSLIVNGFDNKGIHIPGRKDMVYLGQYSRTLLFPQNVTAQVLHPHGGSSYSISYPQQKRSREMKSDTRPNIQWSGHFHRFNYILEDFSHMVALPKP